MNKWRITGADAATGEDRSTEVNARDEAGVREAARMLGMLVARVERLAPPQGPVLDYRSPGLRNRGASVGMAGTVDDAGGGTGLAANDPPYAAIISAAKATVRIASVLSGFGVVALVMAAVTAMAAVAAMTAEERRHLTSLLMAAVILAAMGVGMIAFGAGLRLMSATGLAVRDLTIAASDRDERLTRDRD
jgi:hypothetical protein